jgi:hypothetical protein
MAWHPGRQHCTATNRGGRNLPGERRRGGQPDFGRVAQADSGEHARRVPFGCGNAPVEDETSCDMLRPTRRLDGAWPGAPAQVLLLI